MEELCMSTSPPPSKGKLITILSTEGCECLGYFESNSVPEVIKQIRRKRKEFPETNPLDYYLYLVISLDSGLAGKISCSLQLVLPMWGHFGMATEGLHNAFAPYVSWTTLALILSIILLPTF